MYMDVASYYINTAAHGGHDILCHLCEFGSIKSGNVPSWVPDWSTRRHPESYIAYDSAGQHTLRAWTWKITDVSHSFCNHILPNHMRYVEIYEWLTKRSFFSTKLVAFGQRLRVDCHPLAFVGHGGIADRVICHSAAPNFWEEVIAASELEIIHYESNKTERPDDHSLITFLARNHVDFGSFDSFGFESTLHFHIDELRKALLAFRDQRDDLNDDHKIILEQISSSLHRWVIVRIQAMTGPYWAYGPPNSLVGDWVVPLLLAQQDAALPMMCLRPIRPAETEPLLHHPLGDGVGERCLRFFSRENATEIGCLHVTATFVGLACLYDCEHDVESFRRDSPSEKVEMVNIVYCATAAARVKGLLGPIVFDII